MSEFFLSPVSEFTNLIAIETRARANELRAYWDVVMAYGERGQCLRPAVWDALLHYVTVYGTHVIGMLWLARSHPDALDLEDLVFPSSVR